VTSEVEIDKSVPALPKIIQGREHQKSEMICDQPRNFAPNLFRGAFCSFCLSNFIRSGSELQDSNKVEIKIKQNINLYIFVATTHPRVTQKTLF
jgi:hypothetical protein